jgi:hypothetical protein
MAHEDRAVGTRVGERTYWLDDPRHVDFIVWGVYAICALLLAASLLIEVHGPFAIEHLFGFYGFYGFISCVGLVLVAKGLRVFLKRPEDYYDR